VSNTEPDAGGTQNFFRSLFQRNTTINAMAGSEIKVAGLEEATRQMGALNTELAQLVQSLTGLSQQQAQLTQGISTTMRTIATNAQQTSSAVGGATEQMGRFRSGAMSIAGILGSAVNSNFVKDLAMFPLRYITSATEQARNLGMGVSTTLGGQMYATGQQQGSLMNVLSNFPGGVQGGVEDIIGLQALMRQYGAMADLSGIPTGPNGAITPGASSFQQNPRAVGFLRGVREMQQMTPGAPVAQLAQTLGQFSANTGAQQQAAYLTGGAFAMIGAGGHQKSVSEWAEGILKWLQDQRPGDNRGKGFNYGELLAQQFPGSNIDAWLSANGVTEGLKEYWWNYALAKARMTGSTTNNVMPPAQPGLAPQPFSVQAVNTGPGQGGNQAFARLGAASAQSRGQMRLGGALSGMFANKETANQWFNELIAQVMSEVIPHQIAGGSLQALGVMPDPIQELLMTFLERSGTVGAAIGGYIGYGVSGLPDLNAGLFQQLFAGGLPTGALGNADQTQLMLQGFGANPNAAGINDLITGLTQGRSTEDLPDWLQNLLGISDVGDIGDVGGAWTKRGTTSTAGLHPTVRRGVERMMGDNPRVSVTSGLRDTVQQRRLRAAGNTGVSGKPSAHTRGLAADLGPPSQYKWIAANASKYGLRSGLDHGEPWHVGLPGIGDVGGHIGDPAPAVTTTDTTTVGGSATGLGSLFDMFKEGFTKQQAIEGIGSLVPALLSLFLGTFGMGGTAGEDMSSIAYDPNLYAALRKAAAGPEGIITYGGAFHNTYTFNANTVGGGGGGGSSGSWGDEEDGGGADGWRNTSGVLPAGAAAFFNSDNDTERAAATAAALKAAGFGSQGIHDLTKIAWRESRWKPGAQRSDHHMGDWRWGDRGLFQINAGENQPNGSMDAIFKSQGIIGSSDDLRDPVKNARAAGYVSKMGSDLSGWGADASGWVEGGDPFFGTSRGAAAAEAGLVLAKSKGWIGDVEPSPVDTAAFSMDASVYPSLPVATSDSGQTIMFNNTFNISGGGGQGGFDVRRTVTTIANQLEDEMKRRLERSN